MEQPGVVSDRESAVSDEATASLLESLAAAGGIVDNPEFDTLTANLLGNETNESQQNISDDLDEVTRVASQILRESVQEELPNYDLMESISEESGKPQEEKEESRGSLEDWGVSSPCGSGISSASSTTKQAQAVRHSARRKEREFKHEVEKIRIQNEEEEKVTAVLSLSLRLYYD